MLKPTMIQRCAAVLSFAVALATGTAAMAAPAGTPLTAPVLVVAGTAEQRPVASAIASDAVGNFVVAWSADNASQRTSSVSLRRFAANGTALGDVITLTEAGSYPAQYADIDVAMNATGSFVVTWTGGDGNLYARLFAADGAAVGADILVAQPKTTGSFSDASVRRPVVEMDAKGGFVIAWGGTLAVIDAYYVSLYTTLYIDAQRYQASGAPAGRSQRVTSIRLPLSKPLDFLNPILTMKQDTGEYAIAWRSGINDRAGPQPQAPLRPPFHFRLYTTQGKATSPAMAFPMIGARDLLGQSSGLGSVVFAADGDLLITWGTINYTTTKRLQLYCRRYSATGVPRSAPVELPYSDISDKVVYMIRNIIIPTSENGFVFAGGYQVDGDAASASRTYYGQYFSQESIGIGGVFTLAQYPQRVEGAVFDATLSGNGNLIAAFTSGTSGDMSVQVFAGQ